MIDFVKSLSRITDFLESFGRCAFLVGYEKKIVAFKQAGLQSEAYYRPPWTILKFEITGGVGINGVSRQNCQIFYAGRPAY